MRKLLAIMFVMFVAAPAHGQRIIARRMPFFHQLPSNEIWDVGQDREGYLWICTRDGLARYDGYRLQFFRSNHNRPDLLTDNSIVCSSDGGQYIWIGTRAGLNLFDKTTCRITPFPDPVLQDRHIAGLTVDGEGNMWVASDGTMYRYTPDLRMMGEYPITDPDGGSDDDGARLNINSIYIDREGTLWVMAFGSGPIRYDAASDSFAAYSGFPSPSAFIIYQDAGGDYWIGTWGDGFWQFFPDRQGAECYVHRPIVNARTGEDEPIIYSITRDDTFGYLWVLSYNELYALRPTPGGELQQVDIHDLVDTHMMYTRIFKDREGNLWLSSFDMAYTIFFDHSRIDNYTLPRLKETMGWDANLLVLCPDSDGVLWMNQDRYGLCLYDPVNDVFSRGEVVGRRGTIDATLLTPASGGGMWIKRSGGSRLARLSRRGMTIHVEEDIQLGDHVADQGEIRQLQEDLRGNLWIRTSTRLLMKPAGAGAVFEEARADSSRFTSFAFDRAGRAWAVSEDWNLYGLELSGRRIDHRRVASLPIPVAAQERIEWMCVDSEDCVWTISSLGRICRSDPGKQRFEMMAELEGEIEDFSVLNLLADGSSVWIATNKRVIRWDVARGSVRNYETSDGNISVNLFRSRAVATDGAGGLYAGGHGGFIRIGAGVDPDSRPPSPPVVTDVTVDNRSVFFSPTRGTGKRGRVNTPGKIWLEHDARNIQFAFSTLEYSLDPGAKFAWMLEGEDSEWIYPDGPTSTAFYNGLGKGVHRFWLRTQTGQGEWSAGQVALVVEKAPAFWETWWATVIYILVAGGCVWWTMRLQVRRIERRGAIQFNEELNRVKLDYFTSVSHELLTPLTIISTAVEQNTGGPTTDPKQSRILRSNVDKLKRLILQILDFRKMDMGRMTLAVSWSNIGEFVTAICQTNFSPLARKKGIDLEVTLDPAELWGWVDLDKFDTILYNLLSNAVKYTPEGGRIGVDVVAADSGGHRMLVLKVEDTGIGIAPGEIDRIFTRFYSDRKAPGVESNGIGLSLIKDLVELHHGRVGVESVPGRGSCFTIELPIGEDAYPAGERLDEVVAREHRSEIVEPLETSANFGATEKKEEMREEMREMREMDDAEERPTILLVDDNAELLYTMRGIFSDRYRVLTATGGDEAWARLNAEGVDVTICDVMMPGGNGWDLCGRIKGDLRFNHIPVIILTARKGIDDQISSYEAGADGYIAKPFESEVLRARVDNLLRSYRMRRAAFLHEKNIDLDGLNYPRADRQFLETVIGTIEKHLETPDFDLDLLASDLGMSKSTLHRKIKAMTGLTPLDFIRNIKMKRACMMLLRGGMNVSEVAYAVGFNNPKYFTRCFKEEFGVTPSEYTSREQ